MKTYLIQNPIAPRQIQIAPKPLHWVLGFALALITTNLAMAQPFTVGEVVDEFSLKNRRTGEDVSLSDFAGKIVVLDFFAYWCAPCAFSSPDIEEHIQKFYADRNGTDQGIEVQVIAVNIENENGALTDSFITEIGQDLVLDDPSAVAWNRFNQTNGIPLFVVINGVADSPSHQQWEVLHNAPSYPGATVLRDLIDTVQPNPTTPEPDPVQNAISIGNGWNWIPWFGRFKADNAPWIFHEDSGWLYLGEGNLNDGQFLYGAELDWIWTSRDVYPRYYSLQTKNWLRFGSLAAAPTQPGETTRPVPTIIDNRPSSPNRPPTFNGFDLSFTTIPISEILSGGPARDGIPAILDPQFVSPSDVNYLVDSDILVSVTVGDVTRGYPFRILNWHEIANDQIGDDSFVVTYCPLCGTAFVFDAEVNGEKLTFGVSGLLYQNNLLMYDHKTESLWSQFALIGVAGGNINERLNWRASEQITWGDWKTKYPNGEVLSTDTGFARDYNRDPYAAYFENGDIIFPTPRPVRDDLPTKEWVWGINVGEVAKAYPLARLVDGQAIRDTVNGVVFDLVLDAAARAVAVTNVQTGEKHINGVGSFWFSWQDFYPETLVYTP